MQDSIFTDPAAIRAKYASKGRNRKLNMATAESLGAAASSISPTQQIGTVSGGTGGTGISVSSADYIADPTLYNDPGTVDREFTDQFGNVL